MIKNIFIPEQIGSYYLFAKRIVGFDIGRTAIHATVVTATGNKRIIQQCIHEPLEQDTADYNQRVSTGLRAILQKVGRYDSIWTALPSSVIVFKELSLPFIGAQKIKAVVPFEVESLLPFSLESAVLDSITLHENTQEPRSDVLVAAAKKTSVDEHRALFTNAGIPVDKITVDLFELYGLYKTIPLYAANTHSVSLIDLGIYTTRIALLVNGQLKYLRTLPKGLATIAKNISNTLLMDTAGALDQFMRFGTQESENPDYRKAAQDAAHELMSDIQVTLAGYTSKLRTDEQLHTIFITGTGADVPGITAFMHTILDTDTQVFQLKKVVHNGVVQSTLATLPNSFAISLATALSSTITQDFNLQHAYSQESTEKTVNKQLLVTAVLLTLLPLSLLGYTYWRVRSLRQAFNSAQQIALNKLKTAFDLPAKSLTNLKKANTEAGAKLASSEKQWSPLSHKNRFSFLNYLYELSRHINRPELGLDLSSISMDQDEITLKGKVKDFDALRKLESELTTELFSPEESLQTPEFQSRPIKLRINKSYKQP